MGQGRRQTHVRADLWGRAEPSSGARGERCAWRNWAARRTRVGLCASFALLVSCAQLKDALNGSGIEAPDVVLDDVALVKTPGQRELRAFFCPRVLEGRLGLGDAGASLLCSQFFGPAPSLEQLGLSFDLSLTLQNPNRVPLPLSAIATAVTLFPGEEQSQLGTTCLKLCNAADSQCRNDERDACADATDVTQAAEVGSAVGKLLIAEGARLASGEPFDLTAPKLAAEEKLGVVVRFSLSPEQLLPLMQKLAQQSADQLQKGAAVSFDIPYALSGKVIADGGSAGPLSVPFGPMRGNFEPMRTETVARSRAR